MEERKTPELRFKGFDDDWEEKKLKDISEPVTRTAELNSTAPVMMITASNGFISQDERYSSDNAGSSLANYTLLKKGELAYNHGYSALRNFGSVFDLRVPEARIPFVYHCFSLLKDNPEFFGYYLNCGLFDKDLRKKVASTARMDGLLNISYLEYVDLDIKRPDIAEQQQIGSFFKNLDQHILLTQEKLDKTKTLKKTMLQKMFPQKGSKVPEIRLEGFSGDWEEKPLNNYLDVSNEVNSEEKYGKKDVLSVSGDFGVVNQIEFQGRSFAGTSVSNYGVVQTGDVVYTKSPLRWQPYGIIKTNKGKPGIVSTLYAVYKVKENTYNNFVQNYFESDFRLNKYLVTLVRKGAKNDMKVSSEGALKGLVKFPSLEEQKAISNFFDNLSEMITTQSQKLDLLKTLKKSLLEKMFV